MHARQGDEPSVAAAEPSRGPGGPVAPGASGPQGLLRLQRGVGNAAVSRLVAGGRSRRLARLITANPGDLADASGTSITTWVAPTIADAINHAPPAAAGPAVALPSPLLVRPRATQAAPVIRDSVSEDDLFERQTAPTEAG